ncbi:trichohyalin-like [Plodia interpunctella]|uniref:trichohyalin-like n=1 Tax=Plodia interpunctella TaxID=58824 RepID=UPI002367A94B|nr:trichohyalin-like [Plodia interpunctella]XP_053610646.1 trichohyalin-like [Plodia interpunctella]
MPLVMNTAEWNRIVSWTDKDKEDPEVVRKREYVRFLDTESNKMTKDWPNSVENVNKRNEELRQARIAAAEQANTKFYKRYVKRKKEEQQRLMYSARDTIFKNKDAPKLMLSAVIETVVQKERAEQLKFLGELRRQAEEEKRHDDDEIIRKAKEWNDLMALKKKRRFDVNKQHQKEILDQAHEITERNRKEYETELEMQKIDNIKAEQEMDAIKEFEELCKAEEKKRIWHDMEMSRKEAERRAREAQARDELDDKLIDVLQRSRARTEATRNATEKELKAEKLRVLEKISQRLESGSADRDAREQAVLEKARDQRIAAMDARAKAQEEKLARFKQDRIDSRKKFLQDEAQRLHELHTMRQWEMMNRFKNEELYEEFQEKLRKERERKIQEYRADILKLWKERSERDGRERAETRTFYGALALRKLRAADNQLLAHADQLIEEAKANHRPVRPLLRAVDRYCKLYRLYPMPELPQSMRPHFQDLYAPWDGSRPDADYRQPAAPPADRGPDAPDDDDAAEDATARRDGMQTLKQAEPYKPPPKVEKKSDDYKRQGKANGMQRSNKQHDLLAGFLPPVCPTRDCSCDLKK